jgi:hypothetical protein
LEFSIPDPEKLSLLIAGNFAHHFPPGFFLYPARKRVPHPAEVKKILVGECPPPTTSVIYLCLCLNSCFVLFLEFMSKIFLGRPACGF